MDKNVHPWIKLWKKSAANELYRAEPFDKWHAWQDLLILANDKGELKTSIKRLKIRWKWTSDKRVRAYLGELKGKGQIAIKGEPSGTTISIVKWALYQADFSKKGKPKTGRKGEQKGKQEDNNKRSSTEPSKGPAPTTQDKSYEELMKEIGDDW